MPAAAAVDPNQILASFVPAAGRHAFDDLPFAATATSDPYVFFSDLHKGIGDLNSIGQISFKAASRTNAISAVDVAYSATAGLMCVELRMTGNSIVNITGPAHMRVLIEAGKLDKAQLDALRTKMEELLNKQDSDSKRGNYVGKGVSLLSHALFQLPELAGGIKFLTGEKLNISAQSLVGVRFGDLTDVRFSGKSNLDGASFHGNWKNVQIDDCSARNARLEIECIRSNNEKSRNKITNTKAEGLEGETSNLADLAMNGTDLVGAKLGDTSWDAKDLLRSDDTTKLEKARTKYLSDILYTETGTQFFKADAENLACMARLNPFSVVETSPPKMTVAELVTNLNSPTITHLSDHLTASLPRLVEKTGGVVDAANLGPAAKIQAPDGTEYDSPVLRLTPVPMSSKVIAKIAAFRPAGVGAAGAVGELEFTITDIAPAWGVVARFMQTYLDQEMRRIMEAFGKIMAKPADGSATQPAASPTPAKGKTSVVPRPLRPWGTGLH